MAKKGSFTFKPWSSGTCPECKSKRIYETGNGEHGCHDCSWIVLPKRKTRKKKK